MENILEVTARMEHGTRIIALKSACTTLSFMLVNAIRYVLREEKRRERQTEIQQENELRREDFTRGGMVLNDLDQRNAQDAWDAHSESRDAAEAELGFKREPEPMEVVQQLFDARWVAEGALETLSTNRYDTPMSVDQAVDFLISKQTVASQEFLEAFAEELECSIEDLKSFDEIDVRDKKAALQAERPQINAVFNGLLPSRREFDQEEPFDALDKVAQHQLAVKTMRGIGRAKRKWLQQTFSRRDLSNLANKRFFMEAIKLLGEWVTKAERAYAEELSEAAAKGRKILTVDDIRHEL